MFPKQKPFTPQELAKRDSMFTEDSSVAFLEWAEIAMAVEENDRKAAGKKPMTSKQQDAFILNAMRYGVRGVMSGSLVWQGKCLVPNFN